MPSQRNILQIYQRVKEIPVDEALEEFEIKNLPFEFYEGYLLESNDESEVNQTGQNNEIDQNVDTDIQDGDKTARAHIETNKSKQKKCEVTWR